MQSENSLLALLRCSRFSRRSLKQHRNLPTIRISDSSPLLDWIAMQSYENYLIEYQVFIRFLPTIPGRKWSGEIRQKPVYKGLLLKVGNGRKKILYLVSIGREFLPRFRQFEWFALFGEALRCQFVHPDHRQSLSLQMLVSRLQQLPLQVVYLLLVLTAQVFYILIPLLQLLVQVVHLRLQPLVLGLDIANHLRGPCQSVQHFHLFHHSLALPVERTPGAIAPISQFVKINLHVFSLVFFDFNYCFSLAQQPASLFGVQI